MSYEHYRSQQVELDRSWPGLEAGPDQIEVDPETLSGVAAQLRGELDQPARATPATVETACGANVCTGWFGYWTTGGFMEHSLQTAGGSIAFYYRKVLDQVEAAAALFDATAQDYESADQGHRAGLTAAAGWDQLAAAELTAVPPAGQFRDSTRVPYIDQYEEVDGYDAAWVTSEMERLREQQTWTRLADAGNALSSAAERLTDIAAMLRGRAGTLSEQWSSETSMACQRALQRIAGTATDLATASRKVSEFTHRSADTIRGTVLGFSDDRNLLEQAQDLLASGEPNRDQHARETLALLNEIYRDVNYTTLPPYVNADLPDLPSPLVGGSEIRDPSPGGYVPPNPPSMPLPPAATTSAPMAHSPTSPSDFSAGFAGAVPAGLAPEPSPTVWEGAEGVSGGGLAGAAAPAGIGPASGHPGAPGSAPGGIGGGPGAGLPGAGTPASYGPGGVGMVPGATTAAGRGAGAGGTRSGVSSRPIAAGGVVPTGIGGGTSTGGRQGGGRPGTAGNSWSQPSASGSAAGAGGSGRAGTAGAMVPMTGGARDTDPEKASRHDSWLIEDDDPWHSDDDVPPPVLR